MRKVADSDPDLANRALAGLRAYQSAPPVIRPADPPVLAKVNGASLTDRGGSGPPVLLVPSLINPPRILDLDSQVSLAQAIAAMDRRALLVDWGPAEGRRNLSVAGHVHRLLLPLIETIGEPPVLVGYCLGGTMAIAAASRVPCAGLVTLAAPWNFAGYPEPAREALRALWAKAAPAAQALGLLPIEVLQAAFWAIDPLRTVAKFAHFAALAPDSAQARRFVEIEEWANDGEALPFAAAAELIEDLFVSNATATGRWRMGGAAVSLPDKLPALHCTAHGDRITPAATAPPGPVVAIDSGHVGMVIGSKRAHLHAHLARFLASIEY